MTADDAPSLPPVHRQIVVPTDPADAFRLWTDELSRWWPFAGHSVFGVGSTVAFSDGHLVETSADGETSVWGTVLDWVPGERLRLTWHPGGEPDHATEVAVRFAEIDVAESPGRHTLVSLEHRGWERRTDGAEARGNYDHGWSLVIAEYGQHARPSEGRTWLVLTHTAGPKASADQPIFAHPDFEEHVAFLERLAARDVLVAAGPITELGQLPSGRGGMTIIRVPDADVDTYTALATEDDQSVVRGLLDVEVTRWLVGLS